MANVILRSLDNDSITENECSQAIAQMENRLPRLIPSAVSCNIGKLFIDPISLLKDRIWLDLHSHINNAVLLSLVFE